VAPAAARPASSFDNEESERFDMQRIVPLAGCRMDHPNGEVIVPRVNP
jgi:hypothetical protein